MRSVWARRGVRALALLFVFAAACGEPELNDEARDAEGSGDPTGSTGSPAPGLPPQPPSGVPGAG